MTQDPLTPEERDAVNRFLPEPLQTGDPLKDLPAAFRAAREAHDVAGRIAAYTHRRLESWPQTAHLLGEPETTLRRWAAPYRAAGEGSW